MKTTIEIEVQQTGNPMRGYHDHNATVKFIYGGDSRYTEEKEKSIVDSLIGGGADHWMWYKPTNPEPGTWQVRYGYDSSD